MGMQNVGGRRKRESSENVTQVLLSEGKEDQLLSRILLVGDNFMRAWLRNKLTKNKDCHMRNICEANSVQFKEESSEIVSMTYIFSVVVTSGLVREIVLTGQAEEYYKAGSLGDNYLLFLNII